ncbi:thioredoxin family protein [Gracilibacillus caseinilyticus]|uniref:Thioredoxin family protein n=1 Tax=Gracilibacillus caseinilyticus TaxID=2932256 RepID=A0ABY4F170_9BACI|nr:thioredoxin family protein [Gracilibacillus caseinilyticus]UOQ48176.1 thioredoxin family protein [Gracilibacillus caseinilyticus]
MMEMTTENFAEILQEKQSFVMFVHTPFCATCQLAEKMITIMEQTDSSVEYYRMNASFFPAFMESNRIHSVPALLFIQDGQVIDQLYAFESVTKLHGVIDGWKQKQSIS